MSEVRYSVKRRMLAVSVTMVAVIAGLFAYFIIGSQTAEFEATWAAKTEAELSTLRVGLQEELSDGDRTLADQTLTRMGVRSHVAELSLVIDGVVSSSTRRANIGLPLQYDLDALSLDVSRESFQVMQRGGDLWALLPMRIRKDSMRGYQQALLIGHYDLSRYQAAMYRRVYAEVALLLLVLAIYMTIKQGFLNAMVMRPLSVMVRYTRRLQSGEWGSTLHAEASAEFGELQDAFNAMSISLRDSLKELHDQNARNRAFATAFPDVAFFIDDEGIVRDRYGSQDSAIVGPALGEMFTAWLPDGEAEDQQDARARVIKYGDMVITEFQVNDYYVESRMAPLLESDVKTGGHIGGVLWLIRDISEIKRQQLKIAYQANFDPLTNLTNRRLALIHIEKKIAHARRSGRCGVVMFIDLDHFARINDSLGHPVGDKLLIALGERLVATMREEDVVARLGGDEFLVIPGALHATPDMAATDALHWSTQLLDTIRRPFCIDEQVFHLSASIGVAIYPSDQCEPYDVIRQADTAMYDAKASGRDGVSIYTDSMLRDTQEKLALYTDLRHAIAEEGFTLVFQPQFNEHDDVIGAEVLTRWVNRGAPVSPEKFIAAAESTNQILPLGQWILKESCRSLREWIDRDILPASFQTLAINISAIQFMDLGFEAAVIECCECYALNPAMIELELTESVFVGSKDLVQGKMNRLREKGFQFALDDCKRPGV